MSDERVLVAPSRKVVPVSRRNLVIIVSGVFVAELYQQLVFAQAVQSCCFCPYPTMSKFTRVAVEMVEAIGAKTGS